MNQTDNNSIRICDYCENEYKASRSNQKYCSGSCKSQAYAARKVSGIETSSEVNPQDLHVNSRVIHDSRQSRRRGEERMTITKANFNKLMAQVGNSKAPLESLLIEKDYGRNIGIEKAKLEIDLKYTQKELDHTVGQLKAANDSIEKLNTKLTAIEQDGFTKFTNFCNETELVKQLPGILMKFTGGQSGNATKNAVNYGISGLDLDEREKEILKLVIDSAKLLEYETYSIDAKNQ